MDYHALDYDILSRTDIRAAYEEMGVVFSANTPSRSGWLECHSRFRDDEKPSAAVCVASDNGKLGRYTDRGQPNDGCSLWDFSVRIGRFADWREARAHYATIAGVSLNQPAAAKNKKRQAKAAKKELATKQIKIRKHVTLLFAKTWSSNKHGVTVEAIAAAGGMAARWHGPGDDVIAFLGFRPPDWKKPTAAILYRTDGQPFAAWEHLGERKVHDLAGSQDSIIIVGSTADLDAARTIWKCEGLPDALAAHAILPAGHIAITNTGGANFDPALAEIFRGKAVRIVEHADKPGVDAASTVWSLARGVTDDVRTVRLPFEITPDHGKDLRDWIVAGGTFNDLEKLAADSPQPTEEKPAEEAGPAGSGESDHQPRPITNAEVIEETTPDGETTQKTIPREFGEILNDVHDRTDRWPRRANGSLFVDDENGVSWLEKSAALFGWLANKTGPVEWHRTRGCLTKEEFFHELTRTAVAYQAIEAAPHEPPIDGHYYACEPVTPGDGTALAGLLDRFSPAGPIDRDLIQAAMVTTIWGGPGGSRPAFVITSDGRGIGKSTVAKVIAEIAGGLIDFEHDSDGEKLKKRILSPGALTKRIALLDNIKSPKFSWAQLEALITASTISGHRMYIGESTRPNTLVWFITLNGPSMSTDLAQRCVFIKLAASEKNATWEADTLAYVRDHRQAIIGDLVACLREEATPLRRYSRWATWEAAVLCRLPEPEEAQAIILERQNVIDAEIEEAGIVEEFFAHQLRRLNYRDDDKVHIPSPVASQWFSRALETKHSTQSASRAIKQMIDERRLKNLTCNASRKRGRGFVWEIPSANATGTYYDIEDRLK